VQWRHYNAGADGDRCPGAPLARGHKTALQSKLFMTNEPKLSVIVAVWAKSSLAQRTFNFGCQLVSSLLRAPLPHQKKLWWDRTSLLLPLGDAHPSYATASVHWSNYGHVTLIIVERGERCAAAIGQQWGRRYRTFFMRYCNICTAVVWHSRHR